MPRLPISSRNGLICIAFFAVSLVMALSTVAFAEPYVSCETPRQATMTFINNLQEETWHPDAATTCFDWGGLEGSPELRVQRVRQLLAVLDARGHYVYYDKLPDSADYQDEAGWSKFTIFPGDLPSVALAKSNGQWTFTRETVNAIPQLYDDTFPLGLSRLALELPPAFHGKLFKVAWWQYAALSLLILLSLVLGAVAEALLASGLRRLASRQAIIGWSDEAIGAARWPITLLVMGGLMLPLLPELALPVRFALVLHIGVRTIVTGSIVLILFRMVDALSGYLEKRAARTATRLDDQLVPLVRKSLKTILGVLATIFILQNLDVDVGSLLAGLGIGGLAFALAAKDTLANMFGSLTIFLDRPFQIGDWVQVAGVEGTVEEVGFRSTRIRTFAKARVTVPNSTIANAIIDNMSERPLRRLRMVIGLTYDATPDQIQAYCEGVRAILRANPGVFHDYYEVHLNDFGPHALEILVYAFLDVDSWTRELTERHNILLECMRLASRVGVSFAFPTQTLHIETFQASINRPQPSRDELRRVVDGFAPGGDLSQPRGVPLTDGYMPQVGSKRGASE